jgi:hypothetical protein
MDDFPEVQIDPTIQDNDGGQGINPAWNDLMQVIPEDIHSQVIPHLRNWDSGVQTKIQSVHSEWEPYKFLKEGEVSPDDARVALGILRAVQEDPKAVYDSLAESYGFNESEPEVEPTETGQGETESFSLPPAVQQELEQLKQGYNAMAEILLQQKNEAEEAAQDASLKQEIDALKAKHQGTFDEDYVLNRMHMGESPDDALKSYQSLVERIQQENNRPKPPMLLGSSGGGVPGESRIDVTKLNPAETKNLVAKYLEAQARANQ